MFPFRNIALVVILTRAGLGLDPVALRKLSFAVIRLAFTPCLVETLTVAVASHLLLAFPWDWGFMLGWARDQMNICFVKAWVILFYLLIYFFPFKFHQWVKKQQKKGLNFWPTCPSL